MRTKRTKRLTQARVAALSATIPIGEIDGYRLEDWCVEMSQYYYIQYFILAQRVGDFQLFRLFYFDMDGDVFNFEDGKDFMFEYGRMWMDKYGNERTEYFDKSCDWLEKADMSICEPDCIDYTYPESDFADWLQDRGFYGYHAWWTDCYNLICPRYPLVDCCREVMGYGVCQGSHGHIETLLKMGWYDLIEAFTLLEYDIDDYWASVKICIRNNYSPDGEGHRWGEWLEYIDLLKEAGKDIRNAHYVCPDDVWQAHQELYERLHAADIRERQRREEEARIARELREAEEDKKKQEYFMAEKGKYFNIRFCVDGLEYHVLSSIDEVKAEAEAMHHCVWTCGVYAKVDTICLSCTLNGERVETIELNLRTGKVVQHHGKYNSDDSQYHNRIARDVEQHYYLFKQVS